MKNIPERGRKAQHKYISTNRNVGCNRSNRGLVLTPRVRFRRKLPKIGRVVVPVYQIALLDLELNGIRSCAYNTKIESNNQASFIVEVLIRV